MDPLTLFLISLALSAVAYIISPKPQLPKQEIRDLEFPTAEAGRPLTVVFGTMTMKGSNILWYGRKDAIKRKIDSPVNGVESGSEPLPPSSGGGGGPGGGELPEFIE